MFIHSHLWGQTKFTFQCTQPHISVEAIVFVSSNATQPVTYLIFTQSLWFQYENKLVRLVMSCQITIFIFIFSNLPIFTTTNCWVLHVLKNKAQSEYLWWLLLSNQHSRPARSKSKDSSLTVSNYKEKRWILKFKKLKTAYSWYWCFRKWLNWLIDYQNNLSINWLIK